MTNNELSKVCKNIYFDEKVEDCLLFVDKNSIIRYNFYENSKEMIYQIRNLKN